MTRPCIKLNVEGVTLYLDVADSKLACGDKTFVTPCDRVKVEAPGFANANIPAIRLAQHILRYEPKSGVKRMLINLMDAVKTTDLHPFLPDKYRKDNPRTKVFFGDRDYFIPVKTAKLLAANYLQSMKSRNPQDTVHANHP